MFPSCGNLAVTFVFINYYNRVTLISRFAGEQTHLSRRNISPARWTPCWLLIIQVAAYAAAAHGRSLFAALVDDRLRFRSFRRVTYALTRTSLGHATNTACVSPFLFPPSFQISKAHFVLRHSYVRHASFHSKLIFLLCIRLTLPFFVIIS